ncbi:MAG: bifunctional phosphoribosylaminoimidazolecarboxamide formyltransferase/IMP cyclohydrolase, partial [Spirochaetota bacterium]
ALLSLSDKEGATELASFLQRQGLGLLASGSTAELLRRAGLDVENISDFTGTPEILGGRVKTLHPRVYGSLLYLRDDREHGAEAQRSQLVDIAVVAVNLYPFARTLAQGAGEGEIIENIDIGGVSLLRAAAKNYQHVSILCQPSDYSEFMDEWQKAGTVSEQTRAKLAAKAYSHTAHYDAMISSWFNRKNGELFPEKLVLAGERLQVARYGENPHQQGAIYRTPEAAKGLPAKQLHGKEMSYNNFLDAEAALGFLRLFSEQAAIIIKHQNPCGSAIERNPEESPGSIYERALACDTVSAFGGIVGINREVDLSLAEKLCRTFYEIVLAQGYSDDALAKLCGKKNLRILQLPAQTAGLSLPVPDFRAISGGFVIQERDESLRNKAEEFAGFRCVSKVSPTEEDLRELLFAWKIASRVKSNAIVFSKDFAAPGIGAGQMSRIDSVKLAAQKMQDMGFATEGAYMASDA